MAVNGTILLGPWGGEGGSPWSHTLIGDISNIFITHDSSGVNSIRFTTIDGSGVTNPSRLFGVANGAEKEIKIDSTTGEKLLSMEGSVGTYNSVERVTSLGFTTSKTKHEPVGTGKKDSEFTCLLSEDPFAGFHGRSSTVLNSIGITILVQTRVKLGPWPKPAGGGSWDYFSKGPISLISATYDDDIVHSLQFGSRDSNGVLHRSNIIGKADGSKTSEIEIDTKVMKIIGIRGAYGPYAGTTLIKSVTFITDSLRSIGPFGTKRDEDTPFSYSVKGDEVITGFHGGAGSLVDAIGLYVQPGKSTAKVGPFSGGSGGKSWNYEPKGLISRIILNHAGALDTIKFETIDENGKTQTSEVFGEFTDRPTYTIDIAKDDKITGISGSFGDFGSGRWFICQFYIYTEKKNVYGPFGTNKNNGAKFSYQVKNGYISGFFGRGTTALGIYVKPT